MPKLPHVSGAEAVRALERLGFMVIRQRGSHIILRRGPAGCVVPNHREIKVGTLNGVLDAYARLKPPTDPSDRVVLRFTGPDLQCSCGPPVRVTGECA